MGGNETLEVPLLPLGKEAPLLLSFLLASSPTLLQTSPDMIRVLHQVERVGRWLIYSLSRSAADGILQLAALTHPFHQIFVFRRFVPVCLGGTTGSHDSSVPWPSSCF